MISAKTSSKSQGKEEWAKEHINKYKINKEGCKRVYQPIGV